MYHIKELQEKVNHSIAKSEIGREPFSLYAPITYTLSVGGKRIRPVLVLLSCNLFSDDIDQAVDAAIGLEIFHNFTLLHDDIMDKADVRRGNPTVHKKWNENTAILSGDAMFIKAYDFLLNCKSAKLHQILTVFNNTALEVCEGQQYDMEFETRNHVSETEYIRMIELKTSVLLAAALKIGAIIGGASDTDTNLLYEFGKYIGLAFQLQDDLLDVYGDSRVFGKEIGGDIVANKKTFLLIKAKELANELDRKQMEVLLNDKTKSREEKINTITLIYNKLTIKEITQQKMQEFHQKAMAYLNEVSIASERKTELINLAETLIQRKK